MAYVRSEGRLFFFLGEKHRLGSVLGCLNKPETILKRKRKSKPDTKLGKEPNEQLRVGAKWIFSSLRKRA